LKAAWSPIAAAAAVEAATLKQALTQGAGQQRQLLTHILSENRDTVFGRQHGFAEIQDLGQFRERVPVRSDVQYRPWLARMAAGESAVLTRAPVIAFESTGGTAGAKLIPYTEAALAAFRAGVLPWISHLLQRFPRIAEGVAYVAASPVTRAPRQLACGLPLGLPSDAAYLGTDLLPALSQVITLPPPATDIGAWRIGTLACLIRRDDLTLISVWSPTFLLELLDALPVHAEAVLAELQDDPKARRRLAQALASENLSSLWPRLQVVSLWMDGASAPYAERVAALLPGIHLDAKGVLATESVITVRTGAGVVPAVTSAVLEFIADDIYLSSELRVGQRYRVALTTPGGLYRYDIGDEFECTAMNAGIPQLRFAGRAGVVSDLVGEKLSDSFVAQALAAVSSGASLVPRTSPKPHYQLWLNCEHAEAGLASRIDARLSENPQYAYARRLGQLRELEIVCSPGFAQYRARLLAAQGGRLGDAKSCALILDATQLPVH
jgi:hypothetical protein